MSLIVLLQSGSAESFICWSIHSAVPLSWAFSWLAHAIPKTVES